LHYTAKARCPSSTNGPEMFKMKMKEMDDGKDEGRTFIVDIFLLSMFVHDFCSLRFNDFLMFYVQWPENILKM